MLGNFTYCNPTKLYFGKDALDGLRQELPKYGKNVLLVYGGGSIKRTAYTIKLWPCSTSAAKRCMRTRA